MNLTASVVTPLPAASQATAGGPLMSPVAGVAALSSNLPADTSHTRLSPCAMTAPDTLGAVNTPSICTDPVAPLAMSTRATPRMLPMGTTVPAAMLEPAVYWITSPGWMNLLVMMGFLQ